MNSITALRPAGVFAVCGQALTRAFSSTPVAAKKHSKRRLQHMLRNVPKYPYPIQNTFKQSWFGLYGGKHIQFGNNVPESEYKTRRAWLPNVRHRSVFSRALNQHFSIDITTSVLRTIDKVGGLDNYLTGSKPARIRTLGPTGWRLRWRVMNSPQYQKQLAEERKALGLDATAMPQVSMFGEQTLSLEDLKLPTPEMAQEAQKKEMQEVQKEEVQEAQKEEVQEAQKEEVPEAVVVQQKTAAQLLVESIEREKGLKKKSVV